MPVNLCQGWHAAQNEHMRPTACGSQILARAGPGKELLLLSHEIESYLDGALLQRRQPRVCSPGNDHIRRFALPALLMLLLHPDQVSI